MIAVNLAAGYFANTRVVYLDRFLFLHDAELRGALLELLGHPKLTAEHVVLECGCAQRAAHKTLKRTSPFQELRQYVNVATFGPTFWLRHSPAISALRPEDVKDYPSRVEAAFSLWCRQRKVSAPAFVPAAAAAAAAVGPSAAVGPRTAPKPRACTTCTDPQPLGTRSEWPSCGCSCSATQWEKQCRQR